eukprot:357473-Chlamydomonas_euryale.AAC.4
MFLRSAASISGRGGDDVAAGRRVDACGAASALPPLRVCDRVRGARGASATALPAELRGRSVGRGAPPVETVVPAANARVSGRPGLAPAAAPAYADGGSVASTHGAFGRQRAAGRMARC